MGNFSKWLTRAGHSQRATSESEMYEMMGRGFRVPEKRNIPEPTPLGPKRITLEEVQRNKSKWFSIQGPGPRTTTSSSRDPLLSNSPMRKLTSKDFKGKILHTPSRIQKNSRVRKTTIDAKNAISTLDKLKAGTAPAVDKLQRFMINAQNSAKNIYTKVRGVRMGGRGWRAGGMFGVGLAGVMGLSLALSKTRHGRES